MKENDIPLEETQVQEESNTRNNQTNDLTKVQSWGSSAIFYT